VDDGPAGCDCKKKEDVPSRVRDGYQLEVLWNLPEVPEQSVNPCRDGAVPCPECPDGRDLVLACITLPGSTGDRITGEHIDHYA
jgi:hypothetical protein